MGENKVDLPYNKKKNKKKGALICSNDKSLAPDANTAGA